MKRVIKSITASTFTSEVKYLMGDPDDEYALEGYGGGYKVVSYEDIINDMVSGIGTNDVIIRVLDKKSGKCGYVLASIKGRNFDSYEYAMHDIFDALPIKEKPEYDVASKTVYTTYGRSWSYAIGCASLPKEVYDGWVSQIFDLDEATLQTWSDVGFEIASEEDMKEVLVDMLEHNQHIDELVPNPADLF